MSVFYDDGIVRLLHGDVIEQMREIPDDSIDSICTDPPYGLEFMGKEWDGADGFRRSLNPADVGRDDVFGRTSAAAPEYRATPEYQQWCQAWAEECLRVLKPGGHLLAFGGTRTYHRLATAIEDAGFDIRDCLVWGYMSGFPKSLDVSKAIDKAAGADREKVAIGAPVKRMIPGADQNRTGDWTKNNGREYQPGIELPTTDEAKAWTGWGTALKPAWEPIVMGRKPVKGTVAANVLAYGTGGLNIDASRIPLTGDEAFDDRDGEPTADERYTEEGGTNFAAKPGKRIKNPTLARYASGHSEAAKKALGATVAADSETGFSGEMQPAGDPSKGRWPANVVLTDPIYDGDDSGIVVGGGTSSSGFMAAGTQRSTQSVDYGVMPDTANLTDTYADAGGKSRFFLVPKADRAERERGLTGDASDAQRVNTHPTVKPLDLMVHLVRLVTPPGGTVLDPFVGSGTTMLAASEIGYKGIGIDQSEDYLEIAKGRLIATPIGMGLVA